MAMNYHRISFVTLFTLLLRFSLSQSVTQDIRNVLIKAHSDLRTSAKIYVPLTWDSNLEMEALRRAGDQLNICSLSHQGHGNYGENLAMGTSNTIDAYTAQRLVNLWVQEGYTPGTYSHWTQMAWSGSTRFGCGMVLGSRQTNCGFAFLACVYYPPGNVVGKTPWSDLSTTANVPFPMIPISIPSYPSITQRPFPGITTTTITYRPGSLPTSIPTYTILWPNVRPQIWRAPFVSYPFPLSSDKTTQTLRFSLQDYNDITGSNDTASNFATLPSTTTDDTNPTVSPYVSYASPSIVPPLFVFAVSILVVILVRI